MGSFSLINLPLITAVNLISSHIYPTSKIRQEAVQCSNQECRLWSEKNLDLILQKYESLSVLISRGL